jgi:hypothetical protein
MYQLIYVSVATTAWEEEALSLVVQEWAAINEKLNITGVLIYKDQNFMQLIEGDEAVIRSMFDDRIAKDKRHTFVNVIYEGQAPKREFSSWSMLFFNLETHQLKKLLGDVAFPFTIASEKALNYDRCRLIINQVLASL